MGVVLNALQPDPRRGNISRSMRRFLRAFQERRRANQADAPPGNVRQTGAPIWRRFGPLILFWFRYPRYPATPWCWGEVLARPTLSPARVEARSCNRFAGSHALSRKPSVRRAFGPLVSWASWGSQTILLIDNRSRAEADNRTVTSKLWRGFASAVELLAGDAREAVSIVKPPEMKPRASRHCQCRRMPRSMCPKGIGGRAVRAEVGRTDARKTYAGRLSEEVGATAAGGGAPRLPFPVLGGALRR